VQPDKLGGIVVSSNAGHALARILPPTARDAQGTSVPVRMQLAGDELVVTVMKGSRDLAYPLFVDPEVRDIVENAEGWRFKKEYDCGPPISGEVAGGARIHASSTTYPYKNPSCESEQSREPKEGYETQTEMLDWNPTQEQAYAVEASNISFSAGISGEVLEPEEGAEMGFGGQDGSRFENEEYIGCKPGYFNCDEPENYPSIIRGEADYNSNPLGGLQIELRVGEKRGEQNRITVEATLSIGSILMSAPLPFSGDPELFGEGWTSLSSPHRPQCNCDDPVNTLTGNEAETQTDLVVGGRGLGLNWTRTYNSQLAVAQHKGGGAGSLGYGWRGSYSAHLEVGGNKATVYQDDGSTVPFMRVNESSPWEPIGTLVQATLTSEGGGYTYTLPDQTKLYFSSTGLLTSEADRNGNTLTMHRTGEGRLESVSDAAGRELTITYNTEGQIESVADPMGHTVKYTYEAGNLASVTEPGETSLRWRFKYNSEDEMTTETDGREHSTTTEYDSSDRVIAQTDPLGRVRKWEYAAEGAHSSTHITEPNGSHTIIEFNALGLPIQDTKAAEITHSSTTDYRYDSHQNLIEVTDPNKHKTHYTYNTAGDRTSETNALEDKTEWTYDSTHDVTSVTTPKGETTTIRRESHGNPEAIERPAPHSETQVTKYKYDSHGDLESLTDPTGHTWKYEYDSYGDRTAAIDPEGNKRTWAYNEDSQETSSVSPRGHVKGAKESSFTTKTERDARGRPIMVTDPLGHATKYKYDGNGNLESVTDPLGHTTTYKYDADNEPFKTEEPDGSVTETEYDAEGEVSAQTDGNKNTIKYEHNVLGEVTEESKPKGSPTEKEYDEAGNLTKVTQLGVGTTIYAYNAANQLAEISYSDGKTPTVKYEYDADGNRAKMTDGTGTTTYTYDQLERLSETQDGHGDTTSYEYNLDDEPIKIIYPNGKSVTRAYDKDGRLEKTTDWLEHTTSFTYNPDSDLTATIFPSTTGEEDEYTLNDADQLTKTKMEKGSEVLASLTYARDSDGQLKSTTQKGFPGAATVGDTYDESNRLTKGGTVAYKYDSANNPTTIGSDTDAYNSNDELENATASKKIVAKYFYNELGDRTTTTPTTGPATSYGYDQAADLTSVTRPKEGETPAIEDSYAYNGEGLRASQTIGASTSYLAWDMAEHVPPLLSDGTNSYIYGPEGLPVEQINSEGHALFVHHDQQGSTRMLTATTGAVEATMTYDAYGNETGHTGTATAPLGYDGQYTSSDTGLIYLRARTYDPATAQFLSVDPFEAFTGAPYNYAANNPANGEDRSGLLCFDPTGLTCPLEHKVASGFEHALNKMTFGVIGSSAPEKCSVAFEAGEGLGFVSGLFVPGEDDLDAASVLGNPDLVEGLTPGQVDDLAGNAGYSTKAGGVDEGYSNPGTKYYAPGTNNSEGFRVLPEGVEGQGGLKEGPYLRYFGGVNDGVGVPLISG